VYATTVGSRLGAAPRTRMSPGKPVTIRGSSVGAYGSASSRLRAFDRVRTPLASAPMGYTDAPPGWWRQFVLASPARTAKLAVVRADGSPHVAPIWVGLDGDDVLFMTSATTIKGKAILRDPRVSLCWDDERPPFSFVTISGTASVSADPDAMLEWAIMIAGRYMGAGQAEMYGRRNAVNPELLVRVHPNHVVAKIDVAD